MTTAGEQPRTRLAAHLDLDAGDPVWLEVLREACAIADVMEQLEAQIAEMGTVVAGSQDQPRTNPLLQEVRAQRQVLTKLLLQLGTDDSETTTQRQARVARKRWS